MGLQRLFGRTAAGIRGGFAPPASARRNLRHGATSGRSLRSARTRKRRGPSQGRSSGPPMAAPSNLARHPLRRGTMDGPPHLRHDPLLGPKPAERTHVCQNCGPPLREASARHTRVRFSSTVKGRKRLRPADLLPPRRPPLAAKTASRRPPAPGIRAGRGCRRGVPSAGCAPRRAARTRACRSRRR